MRSKAYYNENDPAAAAWLRELIEAGLIAPGEVDERSIADVRADDLVGFTQCHWFAGVAGWSYALRLAGWEDSRPVWTGSAPCQPWSAAGKRKGAADERHLWPAWFDLIRECRPERIFGEQVASAVGHGWLDGISADLEAQGYAVGAVVLGAHSVGAPHIRQRLWWVAESQSKQHDRSGTQGRRRGKSPDGGAVCGLADATGNDERRQWLLGESRKSEMGGRCVYCGLEHAESDGRQQRRAESVGRSAASGCGAGGHYCPEWDFAWIRPEDPEFECCICGLVYADGERRQGQRLQLQPGQARRALPETPWSGARWPPCADGKARRIGAGIEPLADGAPARVGLLRGYGNSIVPQCAAEFVEAYLEST